MPKENIEKYPDHPVFTVVNMPNIMHDSVSVELTEKSKEAFTVAQPKQGFIGIAELNPDSNNIKIHLVPAFNSNDGLAQIDKYGNKLPKNAFTGVPLGTLNAQSVGSMPLHMSIAQSLGLGEKAGINGLTLGFGIWKSGCGLKFVNSLPPREGRIPNEVVFEQEKGSSTWNAYYVDNKRSIHKIDLEADKHLKQFMPELDQYTPKTIPNDLRFKMSNALQKHPEYGNETLEIICYIKNRSASMNTHSIKYTEKYRDIFAQKNGHHGSHSADLIREIPSPILNKILQATIHELQLNQTVDIYNSDIIPDGPDGIEWHFAAERQARLAAIVQNNDMDFINSLFKNGEDTNLHYAGTTPLSYAIETKNIPLIEILFKHKLKELTEEELIYEALGLTALINLKIDDPELINHVKKVLYEICPIAKDYDTDGILLYTSNWLNNKITDFKKFKELSNSENKYISFSPLDLNKESIFHFSARNGHIAILAGLLQEELTDKFQVIINKDLDGNSVLHLAANHPECLSEILKHLTSNETIKAIKTENKNRESALMAACSNPASFNMLWNKLTINDRNLLIQSRDTKEGHILAHAVSNQNHLAIHTITDTLETQELFNLLCENQGTLLFEFTKYATTDIYETMIRKLSYEQITKLTNITNKYGETFIQSVLLMPNSNDVSNFKNILNAISANNRLDFLMIQQSTGSERSSILSNCTSIELLSITLKSLPIEDRFKALTTPINEQKQSLLDLIKNDPKKLKVALETLSTEDQDKVKIMTRPKVSEPPKPTMSSNRRNIRKQQQPKTPFSSNPGDGFDFEDIFSDPIK